MPQDRSTGCSVEGCERPYRSRGFCKLHYERWRRTGSTDAGRRIYRKRPNPCPFDGCATSADLDDWCSYFAGLQLDRIERESTKVDPPADPMAQAVDGPCWVGVGSPHVKGYRQQMIGGRMRRLHRVAKACSGEAVGGMVIDHLCRNRGCLNPDHLEVVTHAENNSRGLSPTAQKKRQTHCVHGHEFNAENTIIRPGGRRGCLACKKNRVGHV